MKKYNLAIIGATGLVGREVIKLLNEYNFNKFEYTLFSSENSAGSSMKINDITYLVRELNSFSFNSGFDFAIFCAGSEVSKKYVPIAVEHSCTVIDNSSFFRMNDDVPLVVPEVNPQDLITHKGIISNPNCSTIQAVLALKFLDKKYNIKRIIYSTYQAVSGAGKKGITDLHNGILDYLKPDNYVLNTFNSPIFSNCIPQIDEFTNNGYTKEEEKMIQETRKILHKPDLKVTATCVRVPVFNCHSESINIEFENTFELEELISVLKITPGIIVEDDISHTLYPTTITANGSNNVYIGRIRRDLSVHSGVNIWVVSDNLRKGAATNAIQILLNLLIE